MLKRIVAIPGDLVPDEVLAQVGASPGAVVPPGRLVVRGDGAESQDSRHWGYLPADRVLGIGVRRISLPAVTEADQVLEPDPRPHTDKVF
jgi:signal peptidase I